MADTVTCSAPMGPFPACGVRAQHAQQPITAPQSTPRLESKKSEPAGAVFVWAALLHTAWWPLAAEAGGTPAPISKGDDEAPSRALLALVMRKKARHATKNHLLRQR